MGGAGLPEPPGWLSGKGLRGERSQGIADLIRKRGGGRAEGCHGNRWQKKKFLMDHGGVWVWRGGRRAERCSQGLCSSSEQHPRAQLQASGPKEGQTGSPPSFPATEGTDRASLGSQDTKSFSCRTHGQREALRPLQAPPPHATAPGDVARQTSEFWPQSPPSLLIIHPWLESRR